MHVFPFAEDVPLPKYPPVTKIGHFLDLIAIFFADNGNVASGSRCAPKYYEIK